MSLSPPRTPPVADPLALFLARLQLDERLATEAAERTRATYGERVVTDEERLQVWEAMATEDTAGRSPFRFDDLSQLVP